MQMKLRRALGKFKIVQRRYRSISDENVSEEMVRIFILKLQTDDSYVRVFCLCDGWILGETV